jgi:quinolinate synthase
MRAQAFAQVPGLNVYYGPDTYMGRNLAAMLRAVSQLPDQDVAALHPAHTAASVCALLPRLHVFQEGACVVHHLFGAGVAELVRAAYGDAYLTAHFEVRGWCCRHHLVSCSASSMCSSQIQRKSSHL